jgi:LacI family transcriptional regulator
MTRPAPGAREPNRVTMSAVAERAGVAQSSVSRVLNDHPNASPALRQRVLAAMAELGYEVDMLASGLRRARPAASASSYAT